jgi:hypothetical protein
MRTPNIFILIVGNTSVLRRKRVGGDSRKNGGMDQELGILEVLYWPLYSYSSLGV